MYLHYISLLCHIVSLLFVGFLFCIFFQYYPWMLIIVICQHICVNIFVSITCCYFYMFSVSLPISYTKTIISIISSLFLQSNLYIYIIYFVFLLTVFLTFSFFNFIIYFSTVSVIRNFCLLYFSFFIFYIAILHYMRDKKTKIHYDYSSIYILFSFFIYNLVNYFIFSRLIFTCKFSFVFVMFCLLFFSKLL